MLSHTKEVTQLCYHHHKFLITLKINKACPSQLYDTLPLYDCMILKHTAKLLRLLCRSILLFIQILQYGLLCLELIL